MSTQDPEVTASDTARADAVTQARRWLTDQGVEVPSPPPAPPASPATTSPATNVRDEGLLEHTASPVSETETAGRDRRGAKQAAGGSAKAGRGGRRSRRTPDEHDPPDHPEELARGVVLRKLAGQARSRHELDQALRSKQVPADVAHEVLDRMEEVGLVDDAAFARDWVESRQQRRQLSRRALRHELQHKGVDRDQIEEALATVEPNDEYVAARALAERKVRGMTGLSRDVCYRRLAGALARRGFAGGVTAQIINEVLQDRDR